MYTRVAPARAKVRRDGGVKIDAMFLSSSPGEAPVRARRERSPWGIPKTKQITTNTNKHINI